MHLILNSKVNVKSNISRCRRRKSGKRMSGRSIFNYVKQWRLLFTFAEMVAGQLVHMIKDFKENQTPCNYRACKGLELLVRRFAGCKLRVPGGCIHCKRMWQLLELHSHLCADSSSCRVPLCRYLSLLFLSSDDMLDVSVFTKISN